jgi:GDP-L-fucose synthase
MRLYIAGINGMVGSAIALEANAQGMEVMGKSSKEIDLTDRKVVFEEIQRNKPDALIIAAAKVGGIGANSSMPVDFLSVNLQIQTNLLDAAHKANIKKVSNRLIRTPISKLKPNKSLSPIAKPSTSARSQAMIAICAKT